MTPAKFNVSKYDEYSVDRIVAVWPQLGMIHSGLHNCEHISSSSFESSVDVKISWLEAREGYTSEDATPFDYCQELDHIPASSIVTSANVQRQKSDSDCQACGQLLCPQWIQFVFQPEENERIQGLVSEEKLAREERQRTTQYGDDDVRIGRVVDEDMVQGSASSRSRRKRPVKLWQPVPIVDHVHKPEDDNIIHENK